jgi:hypothetical protein
MKKIKNWLLKRWLKPTGMSNNAFYYMLSNDDFREIMKLENRIQPGDKVSCSIVLDCYYDKTVICVRSDTPEYREDTTTHKGQFRSLAASIIDVKKQK